MSCHCALALWTRKTCMSIISFSFNLHGAYLQSTFEEKVSPFCSGYIYHNTFLHSCDTPLYQSYGGQLDLIFNIQTSCWTSWTFLSMDNSILLLWLTLVISNIIFTWIRYQYYGTPPIYSELGVHHYVFFCSQESFSTSIYS